MKDPNVILSCSLDFNTGIPGVTGEEGSQTLEGACTTTAVK